MRDRAILALAVLLVGASPARATTVAEVEPNDTQATANIVSNALDVTGERTGTAGASDDVDFFVFTGLEPGAHYDAVLDNAVLGLGWFDFEGTLLDSIAFDGLQPELQDLVADDNGEIVLAVCGHTAGQSIFDCSPGASGAGPYQLTLAPEPGTGSLALAALGTVAALAHRRRRA